MAGKPDLGEGTGAEARKTSQPGADVKGEGTSARTRREEEGGGQGPGVAHVCGSLTCEGRLCHQRARAVGVRLREESWKVRAICRDQVLQQTGSWSPLHSSMCRRGGLISNLDRKLLFGKKERVEKRSLPSCPLLGESRLEVGRI